MEERQLKKIKRCLEDVIEGRDDLLQNVEELIKRVNLQVQASSKTHASLSQNEALVRYLTKAVGLFSELNYSVLKFLETEHSPKISENIETIKEPLMQANSPSALNDYLKANCSESISMFDFSTTGPKVLNSEVQNDSYVRKPLDNTTLKLICSNLIKTNVASTDTDGTDCQNALTSVSAVGNTSTSFPESNVVDNKPLIQREHDSNTQTRKSPTFSESDVFSTVSSVAYQHPLTKFQPPTAVPQQYDTEEIDKIKENLMCFRKKMGFDSENLGQLQSQFNKNLPSVNFEYEEPVKEIQEVTKKDSAAEAKENNSDLTSTISNSAYESVNNLENTTTTASITTTDENENDASAKLNNVVDLTEDVTVDVNNQMVDNGPAKSTGAIRKQKMPAVDLIEFSGSTSGSESCKKVNSWLNNNTLSENKILDPSKTEEVKISNQNTAIEKLQMVKRFDRNEEVREQARNDMPEIKFVEVEVPKVIKNDLNSDSSSTGRTSNGKKKKVKNLAKENGVYELKKMEPPQEGAVCVFSHIVSPSEFYLQVVDDVRAAYLDEISEELDQKFKKSENVFKTKQEAFSKLGKFCYGYVWGERNAWYRLQVVDWKLGCPTVEVEVQSVDYGFRCITSFMYLREMTEDLTHIPMLAIRCHFACLYPPDSTYSHRLTEWPSDTIEALHDIANINFDKNGTDIKIFQLIFSMTEGDSLGVDLVPYCEPQADTLGTLLADSGLAACISDDYADNPELGEFFEDIDQLENAENLNELVFGYDAKDEMRICRFTRQDGTCYKGRNCKLEHIPLKDGYTTDKTMAFYTAINDPIFPQKGESVQVLVTAYKDACTYLVQFVRNPVLRENPHITMDKDISDLIDAMNHPKIISKYKPFKVYPSEGEVILAFHKLSQVWMRVAVRQLLFNKTGDITGVEVYAVDFGDQFVVNPKDTRVMLEDFMHLPFQVMQIYLDKYQHKTGCDAKKARRFFDKHISYKNFLVHIRSSDAPYKVTLTTFKGREIGPTLIKEGYAEKRSMDLHMAENRQELYKMSPE